MPYVNSEEMACEFDRVQQMSTEHLMTGWFSRMDQLVLKMLEAYPQLSEAHSSFSRARRGISPDRLTDESWDAMKLTASDLARAVRTLGNVNIALCERRTKWGSCGHALLPDSTCAVTWPDWHDDGE